MHAAHLHGPFGLSELGAWEDRHAQVVGRDMDAIQGVLETEPVLGR